MPAIHSTLACPANSSSGMAPNPAICRLCGKDRAIDGTSKPRLPIKKEAHSHQIQVLTGIDVHEDHSGCPPNICVSCQLKLKRGMKIRRGHSRGASSWDIPQFEDRPSGGVEAAPPEDKQAVLEAAKAAATDFKFVDCSTETELIFVILHAGYVTKKIVICRNKLSWNVFFKDRLFLCDRSLLCSFYNQSVTAISVVAILETFGTCDICTGHSRFSNIQNECASKNQNNLLSHDRQTIVAFLHENVIRNVNCQFILDGEKQLCSDCGDTKFQDNLRARESKLAQKNQNLEDQAACTSAKSKVNFVHLSKEQAVTRMRGLSKEIRAKSRQVTSFQKMKQVFDSESVKVTQTQNILLTTAVETEMNSPSTLLKWPADSPQRLFWEQQQKLAHVKGSSGMRWHPMLIRWGISLFMKSPAVYRNINKSGFFKLPHESTIKSYLHFTSSHPDVNPDVLQILCEEFNLASCKEYKKNVALVWDEMHIRSGLVVSKGSGELIGFVQSDKFSSALDQLSNLESFKDPELTTHVIVFMVRGLMSKVNLPFIWYPCLGFNSTELYGSVWLATEALEELGLKVRAFVCDGASANRKFFTMHKCSENDADNFTENKFALGRVVYFVCDVPHLLKTTRNNLENSHGNLNSRNLFKNGKSISWNHVVSTVEEDMSKGLGKLPKVKHEHIRLSPQLRMRVRLASQVLSRSMANAILLRGKPEMVETANFCTMVDKWFDCLNGRYLDEGVWKRKPDLMPYKSVTDPRFAWLEHTFLSWLREWDIEVGKLPDLTKSDRKRLVLSEQTSKGLEITTKSFVSLTKELLLEDGATFFLPEKLNQDRLEVFFSKLRRSVGDSDNPTIEDARHRIIALIVGGRHVMAPKRTNSVVDDDSECVSLPKRKKEKNRKSTFSYVIDGVAS